MKAQTIDVKQATGRILCCTIFRAGGKKLLAKGHMISEEDARMLETEGMNEVWVTELAASVTTVGGLGCVVNFWSAPLLVPPALVAEILTQLSAGTWDPPANGISLDPYETVTAALWCATRATSLRNGLVSAVRLAGDTDTVAALVGGLMGCKLTAEQVRAELPWHSLVVPPEPESAITGTAAALAIARAIQSG